MWYVIFALMLSACDDGAQLPEIDLAMPIIDLAKPMDLTQPIDLATPPLPPPTCTSPQPGIYTEYMQYVYVPAGGPGSPAAVAAGFPVSVKNDGTFNRPKGGFPSPDSFHCVFDVPDAVTCTAQCCFGQPASPTMYFDKGGWTMWTSGSCAFRTTTGADYIATVTAIDGIFLR